MLHELIHGLGFFTLVNLSNGAKPGGTGCPPSGCDDAFMKHIEDHSLAANWPALSNAQRAASAIDDPDLHFTGGNVQANVGGLVGGINQGHARLHGPGTSCHRCIGRTLQHAFNPYQLMEPQQTDSADNLGLSGFVLQDLGWDVFPAAQPILSTPVDQLMLDTATLQLDIAVMDNDSDASSLNLTAASSNHCHYPATRLPSGSGRKRTLSITPNNGTTGVVTITLTVNDGTNINITQFDVEVTDNLPPSVTISAPADGKIFYGPITRLLSRSL